MKSKNVFDAAIVGFGPAGVTAAIYAARKKLTIVMFGELPGGEIANSGVIENWPGEGKTSGVKLAQDFMRHLDLYQDQMTIVRKKVRVINKVNGQFELTDAGDKKYLATTVIYAAGRHPRKLNVPGEDALKNRGVSYCANCDAPLFTNQEVVVVGGGNTGAEAVISLLPIAQKIYLLHIGDSLPADPVLVSNFDNEPKVKIILQAQTTAITGEKTVTALTYANTSSGQTKTIAAAGVFVAIGATPNTQPVKDLISLNEAGAIITDRYGRTNLEGFFAAGDVTDARDAQIVTAAGHGCSAALSVSDYLSRASRI